MAKTLGEIKQDVYKLIEEYEPNAIGYTSDTDYRNKFNVSTNSIMNELDKLTSHVTLEKVEVTKGMEMNLIEDLDDFRLLKKISGVSYDITDQYVTFLEDGTAKIYYYHYLKQIKDDTDDDFKIKMDNQTIDVLEFGIAYHVLMNDVSSNYGAYFKSRYEELKNGLDPRVAQGIYIIEDGVD